MANWNTPVLTDLYTNFLQFLKDRDTDLAKAFDPAKIATYPTNLPIDCVRFSSALFRWEIYNGVTWVELLPLATAKYSINVDRLDGFDAGNASGNVPVSNGTVNVNLNADMIDGKHAGNAADQVLLLDAGAKVPFSNLPLSGIVAGTYKSVTVDVAGRVTAGTNPTTLAGYGITDAAPSNSPTLTGTPLSTTPTAGDNSTKIATTAYTQTELALKADKASPAFTGPATFANTVFLTGVNGAIELGSVTTANTPLFDFHSSGNNIDYDARIIASGGTLEVGQGTLTYTAATHSFVGAISAGSAIYSGFLADAGTDNFIVENSSVAAGVGKYAGIAFKGRDTVNASKNTGYFRVFPVDNNYVASFFSWFGRAADVVTERMRLYGAGRLVLGSSLADNGTDTLQVNGTGNFSGLLKAATPAAGTSNNELATTNFAYSNFARITGAGNTFTFRQVYQGNQGSGMATATGSLGAVEVFGDGTNAAFIAFHRPGAFAAYIGLDTDNVWKVGGWSMGAVAHTLVHSGNVSSFSGFAAGTRLAFSQAAAPVGWTKDTNAVLNDAIMRIVTDNGGGTGGGNAFSTFNGQTAVGATTLALSQIPAHDHVQRATAFVKGGTVAYSASNNAGAGAGQGNTSSTTLGSGGNGSHTHGIITNIKYYDFIICSKN